MCIQALSFSLSIDMIIHTHYIRVLNIYIYIYMYIHNYIIYIYIYIYIYHIWFMYTNLLSLSLSLPPSLPHQQSLDLQFTVRGNLQRFSTLPNSWGFPADVDVCLNSFWDGKPKCLVTFPSKMMMNPRSRVTKWSKMAGWEGPALERNI